MKKYIKESKPIRFDGNGYSDEWKAEAAARGLDCETSTPVIFDAYIKPASVEMFSAVGVMNAVELAARNEVKWEMYTKKNTDRSSGNGRLGFESYFACCNEISSFIIRYGL